jgi:hypothetical protein
MARRVEVKTELTAEALHDRYRHTKDPVERTHWHILWLLKGVVQTPWGIEWATEQAAP